MLQSRKNRGDLCVQILILLAPVKENDSPLVADPTKAPPKRSSKNLESPEYPRASDNAESTSSLAIHLQISLIGVGELV